MDIFGNVDTASLLRSLSNPTKSPDNKRPEKKQKQLKELDLGVVWREGVGLVVSIPDSKLNEIGWISKTKIDIIIHENIIILFPLNGYLNLKKPIKNLLGREVVIPENQFKDIAALREIKVNSIKFDDLTCYHRIIIELSGSVLVNFQH